MSEFDGVSTNCNLRVGLDPLASLAESSIIRECENRNSRRRHTPHTASSFLRCVLTVERARLVFEYFCLGIKPSTASVRIISSFCTVGAVISQARDRVIIIF
jgi:hypothetical protein